MTNFIKKIIKSNLLYKKIKDKFNRSVDKKIDSLYFLFRNYQYRDILDKWNSNYKTAPLDVRRKFFESIPPTKDPLFSVIQEIETYILKIIDGICRKNNIDYFIDGGTLLGAVRHKGPIPWDEDVDIDMIREDFLNFKNVLANNNYPIFIKETIIKQTEKGAHNRIRVFLKEGDERCYVDIFIFDLLDLYDSVSLKKYVSVYENFQKTFIDMKTSKVKKCFLDLNNQKIKEIYRMFGHSNNPRGVYLGIDNFVCNNRYLTEKSFSFLPYDMIYPLKEIYYSSIKVKCPNKYEEFLSLCFGDYYTIPDNMFTHPHEPLDPSLLKKLIDIKIKFNI